MLHIRVGLTIVVFVYGRVARTEVRVCLRALGAAHHPGSPPMPTLALGRCTRSTDISRSRHPRRRRRGRRVPRRCGGRCGSRWGCGRGRRARRSTPSSTGRRARRLHGRARLLRERARAFRHRQLYRPTGDERQAPGGALSARALARRTISGRRREPSAARSSRRAPSASTTRAGTSCRPVRATGADGLRRVSLRHGRLRRQRADPAGDRAQRRAAARVPSRRRAVLQRRRRAAAQLDSRAADLERHPRARLPQRAAGRRSRAHRRHRRQRRRHADVPARRDRRSARRRVSGRDGLDARCRAAARARTPTTCASARATSSSPRSSRRSRWA